MKKLKCTGLVMGPSGALHQATILGPPSYEEWLASFMVFRTGCIMLDVLSPATCEYYYKHIGAYAARYGPQVWPLLYQADVRARLEQITRVARSAAQAHVRSNNTSTFDPKRPWEHSLRALVDDMKFWRRELEEPAILIMTQACKLSDNISDDAMVHRPGGSSQQSSSNQAHRGQASQVSPPPPKKHKRSGHERVSNIGSDGLHTTNRNGKPLCEEWQEGRCEVGAGITCPRDSSKVHQCKKCLFQGHGASNCRNDKARELSYSGGKGSKGKGKKGGKRK